MAHIKALKQRWLQEYQQEQEGKLRAASSAALEGSTLNNGAAPDTASQPRTGAGHLAGHPHGAVESPRHLPSKGAKHAAGSLSIGAKAGQPASPRQKPGKGEATTGKLLEGVGSGGLQLGLGGSEDSNPSSSKQHAGGASKPGQQARKAAKKEGDGAAAAAAGTPVEVMLGDASKARHVGDVALPLCSSQEELWAAIRSSFSAHIPGDAEARLVFQDLEGDWLLLQRGVPWELFTSSAKRLLVCNK